MSTKMLVTLERDLSCSGEVDDISLHLRSCLLGMVQEWTLLLLTQSLLYNKKNTDWLIHS